MAVKLSFVANNKIMTLPINPEELAISYNGDNDSAEVIGLGEVTVLKQPKPITFSLSSFLPSEIKPNDYINFFGDLQKKLTVARFVTEGLTPSLDIQVTVEDFDYINKAGEEKDVYFEMECKQYIPYGARVVNKNLHNVLLPAAPLRAKPKATTTPKKTKTYKVKKGDCLWNITKKYVGKGERWRELYNINKKVVGKNPNLIYPGQVLTIPTSWY